MLIKLIFLLQLTLSLQGEKDKENKNHSQIWRPSKG